MGIYNLFSYHPINCVFHEEEHSMNNPITPRISEIVSKTDDELRELFSELNNASLRKIVRETIHEIKVYQKYIQCQNNKINKLEKRLYNVAELANKEIE